MKFIQYVVALVVLGVTRIFRALTWRDYLRWDLPLPAITGGAAETATTLDRILKEHYPAGGVVNQVNVDTFLVVR